MDIFKKLQEEINIEDNVAIMDLMQEDIEEEKRGA